MGQTAEQTQELVLRRNPAIEAVLANGQLAIEYGFGLQCLNQYLTDLSLLAAVVLYWSIADCIGVWKERLMSFICIIPSASHATDKMLLENTITVVRRSLITGSMFIT